MTTNRQAEADQSPTAPIDPQPRSCRFCVEPINEKATVCKVCQRHQFWGRILPVGGLVVSMFSALVATSQAYQASRDAGDAQSALKNAEIAFENAESAGVNAMAALESSRDAMAAAVAIRDEVKAVQRFLPIAIGRFDNRPSAKQVIGLHIEDIRIRDDTSVVVTLDEHAQRAIANADDKYIVVAGSSDGYLLVQAQGKSSFVLDAKNLTARSLSSPNPVFFHFAVYCEQPD